MDGWALAVAFLALLVAIASALFAYQQMQASHGTLKVESDRLTDERMPSFYASIVDHSANGAAWYQLALRLGTPWHLAKVHVSIPEHQGMSF